MADILVVDDDKDFCDELALALEQSDHTIHKAYSGAQAVETGMHLRPALLITDWMLKENIDGLNVAEVLELVNPCMRVILMTGFASNDLRSNAKYQEVFQFIEKPFRSAEIRGLVEKAFLTVEQNSSLPPIGVLELNQDNEILFSNAWAQTIIPGLRDTATRVGFSDILTVETKDPKNDMPRGSWRRAYSSSEVNKEFLVHEKQFSDGLHKLVVVLTEAHSSYSYEPLVYQTLGLPAPQARQADIDGHVLIIDNIETTRRVAAEILREFCCVCHTAQNHSEGYKLFERDGSIRHVILNFEMNKTPPVEFIRKMLKARPELRVIGSSSYGNLEEYMALGVHDFLPNPWNDDDLLRIMREGRKPISQGQAIH